jgi:hypothetical protein
MNRNKIKQLNSQWTKQKAKQKEKGIRRSKRQKLKLNLMKHRLISVTKLQVFSVTNELKRKSPIEALELGSVEGAV